MHLDSISYEFYDTLLRVKTIYVIYDCIYLLYPVFIIAVSSVYYIVYDRDISSGFIVSKMTMRVFQYGHVCRFFFSQISLLYH